MDSLPERAVVVGAGYIALEFAGILHGMGVETHVMFRADKLLRGYTKPYQPSHFPRIHDLTLGFRAWSCKSSKARALSTSDG